METTIAPTLWGLYFHYPLTQIQHFLQQFKNEILREVPWASPLHLKGKEFLLYLFLSFFLFCKMRSNGLDAFQALSRSKAYPQ